MTSTEMVLPTSVVPTTWDPNTAALMEFAGLTWMAGTNRQFAPAGVTAAFIQACQRTGLDPTAKQIYAAQMGGKWTVLVGVDGMRLVAQRTGQYDGQDPIEWQQTEDGPWSTTPGKGAPYAARIRIYRKGVSRPLEQVVTFAEFGGTGGNWTKRPGHMLGIRAETHGFRRLFPMELSGLYTAEDLDSGTFDNGELIVIEPSEDWAAAIAKATSKEDLIEIRKRADAKGEYTDPVRTLVLARAGLLSRGEISAPEPDPFEADQDDTEPPEGDDPEPEIDPADPRYVETVI
jgi:phage recombination protein Bet